MNYKLHIQPSKTEVLLQYKNNMVIVYVCNKMCYSEIDFLAGNLPLF